MPRVEVVVVGTTLAPEPLSKSSTLLLIEISVQRAVVEHLLEIGTTTLAEAISIVRWWGVANSRG